MAIISAGTPYAATMIPALIFIISAIQRFYVRTSRQLRVRGLESMKPLLTKLTETASGIHHIRAFQWQNMYLEYVQELLDYAQIPAYTLLCVHRWLTLVLGFCVCAVATVVVSLVLKFPEKTNEHAVGLAMLSIVSLNETLDFLVHSVAGLELSLGAVARIKQFCQYAPQEEDGDCEPAVPDHWPSSGNIQFRGVSASYR